MEQQEVAHPSSFYRNSSVVEHSTTNRRVVGSYPTFCYIQKRKDYLGLELKTPNPVAEMQYRHCKDRKSGSVYEEAIIRS